MVHEDLSERLLAEWGEEEELELRRETPEGEVGRREEGGQRGTGELRVSGGGLLLVVVPLEELAGVETLDGAGEGRESIGEEEGRLEDRSRGEKRVVDGVEVAVAALNVRDKDLGIEVELHG